MTSFREYAAIRMNKLNEEALATKGNNFSAHNTMYPTFLMCPPFNLTADNANNTFMKKLPKADRVVDQKKAFRQFLHVYNYVASDALVYVLPHTYGLQDQSFVANLGIVLPHWKDGRTVVISNFRSEPRRGETQPGVEFFNGMNYDVHVSPKYFEGEADLKFVNGNNYIGAAGIRTTEPALKWMRDNFDMNIVSIENDSQELYHLDCMMYPLFSNKLLAVTKHMSARNKREIEKFCEIIEVPNEIAATGLTNCVGLYDQVLCSSEISEMKVTDEGYELERKKVDFLTKVCAQNELEPVFFNLSEYAKNGADLSCMFMHLNYNRLMES